MIRAFTNMMSGVAAGLRGGNARPLAPANGVSNSILSPTGSTAVPELPTHPATALPGALPDPRSGDRAENRPSVSPAHWAGSFPSSPAASGRRQDPISTPMPRPEPTACEQQGHSQEGLSMTYVATKRVSCLLIVRLNNYRSIRAAYGEEVAQGAMAHLRTRIAPQFSTMAVASPARTRSSW